MKNFCFRHKTLIIKYIDPKAVEIIVDPTMRVFFSKAATILAGFFSCLEDEMGTNEDSSVFEFHLRPTLDFQQELLTHAVNAEGGIEVLVPQWLREHMKSIGEDLWHNHQNV